MSVSIITLQEAKPLLEQTGSILENCNSVFRPFKANGKYFMRLVAVKPIRNGDEIFADYGDDYIFDDGSSYKTTYI